MPGASARPTVTLPMPTIDPRGVAGAGARVAADPALGRAPASALERVKILVVDDRPDNLLAVESTLRRPDYEVVLARSGTDGLRFLLREECALILLDVQMPDMDGFEMARLVRGSARTRSIPIVFMTAVSREARFVAKGYEAGAIDYVLKPVDPDVLRAKVAGFVELHRAKQEIVRQARLLQETERLQRERALEQLELRSLRRQQAASERYRRLMEGISHAVVWTLDPETLACSFVSPSAETLLGHPADSWTAEPAGWRDRLPAEDLEPFLAAARSLSDEQDSASLEHGLLRADGGVARFRTELRLFPAGEDGRREIRGFSVDVTEARLFEEALAFLARVGGELGASLDAAETIERAARAAVPHLGDGCAVLVPADGGAPRLAVVHRDPAVVDPLRALAADPALAPPRPNGTPTSPRHVGPDGASLLSLPLRARDRVLGAVHLLRGRERPFETRDLHVAREFTARAAQALENALLYGEAREAIRVREEFISVASHELRTPLTPLALQAAAMQRIVSNDVPEGPVRAGLLSRVVVCARQVERMTRLLANLLDVTRLRANRLDLQLEPLDLRELVLEVATRFQEELLPRGRSLEVVAPEPLPGRWDRTRLDQVLTNLVSNAVRYGEAAPIVVTARATAAGIHVSVRDGGRGIPPEDVGRLFERFERATNSSANGGLGLGLYIVRRVVEAHGGRIAVETALGAGSTFTVELPREPPGAPAPPAA